jgi:hypothetical protein
MVDNDRFYAVTSKLVDYVKSPSLRKFLVGGFNGGGGCMFLQHPLDNGHQSQRSPVRLEVRY